MPKGDEFVDIDREKELAGLETTSYEQILLRQIKEAAIALSQPRMGGQVVERIVKGVSQSVLIPDTREVAIRTVNTLRSLLKPFIKNKLTKEFKEVADEKAKIKTDLDKLLITVNNEKKQAKEFTFIPANHLIIRMRIERECDNAEKLFAVLVGAFHKSRVEIQQYESE